MKVFEVITEHCESGSDKIITTRQYVTAEDNRLDTVATHFCRHCFEYEKHLIGVTEILTVTERVKVDEIPEQ